MRRLGWGLVVLGVALAAGRLCRGALREEDWWR